jgi:putative tryptophan/tyrosine transport system substrate-binding protein
MRRREFIAGLGGAAAWPVVAKAQQRSMPVIGFLNGGAPEYFAAYLASFQKGLEASGFVEGRNVAIEFRWAHNQYDRLPALAAELVERGVQVIVATGGNVVAQSAKGATATIPVVFTAGYDPIAAGLVSNLSRPSSNVTGVTFFSTTLVPKRLALLHELVPTATSVAMLIGPVGRESVETAAGAQAAARALGLELHVHQLKDGNDLDRAFADLAQQRIGGVVYGGDPYWVANGPRAVALAARYAIPGVSSDAENVAMGGLASYGTSISDAYFGVGIYTAKILNGAKPADLPVMQPVKFYLGINLKTAQALGLTVPPALLATADEVIE